MCWEIGWILEIQMVKMHKTDIVLVACTRNLENYWMDLLNSFQNSKEKCYREEHFSESMNYWLNESIPFRYCILNFRII